MIAGSPRFARNDGGGLRHFRASAVCSGVARRQSTTAQPLENLAALPLNSPSCLLRLNDAQLEVLLRKALRPIA